MNYKLFRHSLLVAIFVLVVSSVAFGQVKHEIKVKLDPGNHRIEVVDKITLPPDSLGTESLHFTIHQGLEPEVLDKDIVLIKNCGKDVGRFYSN